MLVKFDRKVKKQLESAIMATFYASDFHRADTRNITGCAGVITTTIYSHYDSNKRLLCAFANLGMATFKDHIAGYLRRNTELKEKLRKVFCLHLVNFQKNEKSEKILSMTLPMETRMSDQSFNRQERIASPSVRSGLLLDFMLGFIQWTSFPWVTREDKACLTANADSLFEMEWREIVTPGLIEHMTPSKIVKEGKYSQETDNREISQIL